MAGSGAVSRVDVLGTAVGAADVSTTPDAGDPGTPSDATCSNTMLGTMDPDATLKAIRQAFDGFRAQGWLSGPIGIAVSGGGDSMALALAASLALPEGMLRAATVDHLLRPDSTGEARVTGEAMARLRIPHDVLTWDDGPAARAGPGNLAAQARTARHRLLSEWAATHGLGAVLLGHTLDDQAETLLMRLQRGSGVDGLSAMGPRVEIAGLTWLRPLLGVRRAGLRALLEARGIGWADDPGNDDPRQDRVRVRQAMAALGLDVEGLAATATRLGRQREVLEAARDRFAADTVTIGRCGEVRIATDLADVVAEDTLMAVLGDACAWVAGRPYRPRFDALRAAWQATGDRTLAGCFLSHAPGERIVSREYAAVAGPRVSEGDCIWDTRWRVTSPGRIGALGPDGLATLKAARIPCDQAWESAPRMARLSAPGLWRGDTLIAAPHIARPLRDGQTPPILGLLPISARFRHCKNL